MVNSKKKIYDDCIGDTVSEGDTSDEECNTVGDRRKGLEVPHGNADDTSKRSQKRIGRRIIWIITAVAIVSAAIFGGVYFSKMSKKSPLVSQSSDDNNSSVSEADFEHPLTTETADKQVQATINEDETSTMNQEESETAPESNFGGEKSDIGLLEDFIDYAVENDNRPDKKAKDKKEKEEDSQPMQWPDLVGMNGDDAKAELERRYGEKTYKIVVMNYNSPTTRDYRLDRIRIFTDDAGVVMKVPRIG